MSSNEEQQIIKVKIGAPIKNESHTTAADDEKNALETLSSEELNESSLASSSECEFDEDVEHKEDSKNDEINNKIKDVVDDSMNVQRPSEIKINIKLDPKPLNDKTPNINPFATGLKHLPIPNQQSPENNVYYVKILPKDNKISQASFATISASTLKISTSPRKPIEPEQIKSLPPDESIAKSPLIAPISLAVRDSHIDMSKHQSDDQKINDVDAIEINSNEIDDQNNSGSFVKKVKMSRELKQLKKLQNSSKILSQFISESGDSNSKQRKSRKSQIKQSTTSINILSELDDDGVVLASKYNRRSRSRSQSTSRNTNISRSNSVEHGAGDGEARMKRTMRSQNVEFVQKQQKFLTRIQNQQDSDGTFNSDDENMELSFNKSIQESKEKFKIPLIEIYPPPKPGNDKFCWRCHQIGSVSNTMIACSKCIRSYHVKCARMLQIKTSWNCLECSAIETAEKSFNGVHAKITIDELAELLNFALKRMKQLSGANEFMPMFNKEIHTNFEEYIVNPTDLLQLQINISNRKYKSTDAFLSDAQWLLHNILIYFSDSPKLISLAKIIFKICKQEMYEIETCHECYFNANSCDDWFTEVCSKPHILLWAKLKSFPYWPAKAMIVNSAQLVSVRFFGDHDRAWVPVKDCFLYSEKDPNTQTKNKRNNIAESIKEVDIHISKIINKFGSFNYAGLRTPFDPANTDQLLAMIPTFNTKNDNDSSTNMKSKLTYKIVKTADNNLSISPISTISGNDKKLTNVSPIATTAISKTLTKKNNESIDSDNMSISEKIEEYSSPTSPASNKITIERKNVEDGHKTYHVLKKKSSVEKKIEIKNDSCDKNENEGEQLKRFVIKRKSDNWNMISIPLKKKKNSIDETQVPVKVNSDTTTSNSISYSIKSLKRKKSVDALHVISENKKKPDEESINIVDDDKIKLNETDKSEKNESNKENSDEVESVKENDSLLPIEEIKVESIDEITPYSNGNDKPTDSTLNAPSKKCSSALINSSSNILNIQDTIKSEPLSDDENPSENDSPIFEGPPRASLNVENKISEIPHLQPITLSPSKGLVTVKDINKMKVLPQNGDKTTNQIIIDKNKKNISASVFMTANSRDKRDVKYKVVPIKTQRARKSFPSCKSKPSPIINKPEIPSTVINKITGFRPTTATLISTNKNSTNMVYIPIDPKNIQNHQLLDFNKFITNTTSTVTSNMQCSMTAATSSSTGTSTIISPIPTNITPIVITTVAATPLTSVTDLLENNNNTAISNSPKHMMSNLVTKTMASAITDAIVRAPPKLVPKPIAPLRVSETDMTIPLDTGPLSRKIIDNAHKMTDYFRTIIEDTIGDLSDLGSLEAKIKSLEIELERLKFNHNQEVTELKHNTDVILCEMRNTMEKEKTRIISETKKQCELERIRAIEETKRKQWCANCSKEAQFYCCWNTSYCDYPCQQKHWPRHMISCAQHDITRSTDCSNKFNLKPATNTNNLSKERIIKPKETNPPKIINASFRSSTPRAPVPLQRLVSINGTGTPCYTIVHTRPAAHWEMLNTVRPQVSSVLLTGTSNITGIKPTTQNGSLMENIKLVPPETFVINQQNMVASKTN